MYNYLINLIGRLGHWGYLIVFFGAMLESAAFLAVFVPGERPTVSSGLIACDCYIRVAEQNVSAAQKI